MKVKGWHKAEELLTGPDLVTDIILQKYDLWWRNAQDGVRITNWSKRSIWVNKMKDGYYHYYLLEGKLPVPEKIGTLPYGKARQVCMRWLMQGLR